MIRLSFFEQLFGFSLLPIIFTVAFLGMAVNAANSEDDISFEIKKTHPHAAWVMRTADIDDDGYMDIVFPGFIMVGLNIMYGKANGDFEIPIPYPARSQTEIIDYINNDSLLDIVTSNGYYLYIMINNGDRTFTIDTVEQSGTNVAGIAPGYFNNDSYLDLIASYDILYLGDGSGSFSETIDLPFYATTVYVSDFNNDGFDDIIALNTAGIGGIYINDGECNFIQTISLVIGNGSGVLATSIDNPFSDFNHDDYADFAFISPVDVNDSSYIFVGYGDGSGGLIRMDTLVTIGSAYSLAIADLNRDNNLDLVASEIGGCLVIFPGDYSGNFSDSMMISYEGGYIMQAMTVGDFDFDGNPDVVAGPLDNDSILLFINQNTDVPVLDGKMTTTGYSNVTMDVTNPGNYKISKNYRTVAGSEYWRRDANVDSSLDEQAIDYNLQYGEYKFVFKTKYNAEPGAKFSADINIGNHNAMFFKDYEAPAMTRGEGGRLVSDSIVFYYMVEPVSSIQPTNGGQGIDQPTFDWSGLIGEPTGGESYNFQLDRFYDFHAPICDVYDLETPQYTPDIPLGVDSIFYWRFRTNDGLEWSEFSRIFAVNIVAYYCGDVNEDLSVNLFDIVYLIAYIYLEGLAPTNPSSADVNADGDINIFDITDLIGYLYLGGAEPNCP